jgi:hypothetical protein
MRKRLSIPKLLLGMLLQNMILPLCAAYTMLKQDVQWGGVKYFRQNGRVRPVRKSRED